MPDVRLSSSSTITQSDFTANTRVVVIEGGIAVGIDETRTVPALGLFSSPRPIGNVTPNTGAFTTATVTTLNSLRFATGSGRTAITPSVVPSTGINWTAIGNNAGFSGIANSFWTAIGNEAGNANTTGSNWTAIGNWAGRLNTTGASWTAIGNEAATSNTTGINWTAIGDNAGRANTTGGSWTAIGTRAGQSSTTGENWTAIGFNAGRLNTTASSWAAIGTSAGSASTTGSLWTSVGAESGRSNTTGGNWVAVGTFAGGNNVSGSNNVFLGYGAGFNELGSNKLYIDVTDTTNPLIWGDFSTRVLRSNGRFQATLLQPDAYTTGTLPSASANPRCIAYDSTLNKLVMSNGSAWEAVTSV